jgi:PAS domain S-box-containing protein
MAPPSAEAWQRLLCTVSRSYQEAVRDRYTMERSLMISSRELRELYDDLKSRSETMLAQVRDKLASTNQFLDSIFENIPNMVFVKDADTLRFVRFNRAGEELIGVQSEELIGKSDHDMFPPEQADFFVSEDRKVLAQTGVVTIEDEPLQTKEHGLRRLRTKKIPLLDDRGQPRYLLGISEDITEAAAQAEELRRAKELAERASRAKSDFLANMSHELRTPLNAILGFARVLDRTLTPLATSEQREFFAYITQAAEHMLRLVNDLLDLRSLDATELSLSRVSIAPVIRDAANMLRPLLDEKQLALRVDIPGDVPAVLANRGAVSQVLINLLSNAVKFTPSGGSVDIGARVDGQMVVISVADTGIGIEAGDQQRLFTYYEQLGAKHRSTMKGSGIGLALTKALVGRQGGSIEVQSAPSAGSTFSVRLRSAA